MKGKTQTKKIQEAGFYKIENKDPHKKSWAKPKAGFEKKNTMFLQQNRSKPTQWKKHCQNVSKGNQTSIRDLSEYCEQIHAWKNWKAKWISQLLVTLEMRKVAQEIRKLDRPLRTTEIWALEQDLPSLRAQGPDGVTGEFYPKLKSSINSIYMNSSRS